MIVFALVLIAACVAAYLAFQEATHYYRELNATRLDPLGLRQLRVPAEPRAPLLVFYGDSRAAHWPEPAWLADRTLNLGISGQTTEQIVARFDHHLASIDAGIVLVQAGMNDLKTIPLFPDQEATIIERCKYNLGRIVERSRAQGAHVLVTSILPVAELTMKRRLFWSDRVDPAMDEVNRFLRSLESDRVTFIETKEILAGENGRVAPAYSRDFLHLSEEGYRHLNESIQETIESITSRPGFGAESGS